VWWRKVGVLAFYRGQRGVSRLPAGVEAAVVMVPLNGSHYQSRGGRGDGTARRLHAVGPRWAVARHGGVWEVTAELDQRYDGEREREGGGLVGWLGWSAS
jgi:hypothetical protein